MTKEERAALAEKQVRRRDVLYEEATVNTIMASKVFRNTKKLGKQDGSFPVPQVIFKATDTVSAFFDIEVGQEEKICILNYASYKHPGGGYIKGSMAQEEALCTQSNLYNVLKSKTFADEYKHNRDNAESTHGLYEDWAIYTPEVIFETEDLKVSDIADVITCPAPNKNEALKYNDTKTADELNHEAMNNRIEFMLDACSSINPKVNTLIIGAWGCGVFGQNVNEVAELFKTHLMTGKYPFDRIVVAVPEENKLNIFKRVFENQ